MADIRSILATHPDGLTEPELLAAARAQSPWLAPRQLQAALDDLGEEIERAGGKIRLRQVDAPASEESGRPRRFVALDMETVVRLSERQPDGDRRPFQIGAVRFGPDTDWVSADPTYEAFLAMRPEWEERLERQDLRQVYDERKVDPAEALERLLTFLSDAEVLVAYNGFKLDFPVLVESLEREVHAGLPERLGLVDGYYLALAVWPVPPRQHRLSELLKRYPEIREQLDIDLDGLQPHNARDDAQMLVDLLRMAAFWVGTWPPDLITLFEAAGRQSLAWQLLFSLMGRPPTSATLDLLAVRSTLAASLVNKPPLRVQPGQASLLPVDVSALQGRERPGDVDIDELVSAIRGEAAEARPAQRDMVTKLREWIAAGRPALVEAPTGTGKSLAAWAVALEWLAADPANRVVISTFTKQLQAQLAEDVWVLERTGIVPGVIAHASLVKGATNRLSVQGLIRVLADLSRPDVGSRRVRRGEFLGDARFAELVLYLCSRLLAEANQVEEWEGHSVDTVDVEPFFGDYLYRRPGGQHGLRLDTYLRFLSQAQGGDYDRADPEPAQHTSSVAEALADHRIVIANHALLLHHLDDFPDPDHTLLVVDEAHALESAATASLSHHFDYPLLEEAVRELRDWIRPPDPNDAAAVKAHEMLSNSVGALEEWLRHERLPASALRAFGAIGRDPLHPDALRTVGVASPLDGVGGERKRAFMEAITRTAKLVGGAHNSLRAQPSRSDRIEEDRRWALLRSFSDLDDALDGIRRAVEEIQGAGPTDPPGNRIVWGDEQGLPTRERRRYRFGITSSPIELRREPVYRRFLAAFGQLFFVSATLRVAGTWDYIMERLGLDPADVDSHDLPSPFKVGQQAKLVCFTDFPSWAEQESVALQSVAQQVHGFLAEMADGNRNGVMVLTTSRAAAAGIGDRLLQLRGRLADPYRIADARISGNARALREFQRSGGALVGTKGLWAGVDVADPDRLRMVWINKLPFAPFGDPVMSARRELVRRRAEEDNDPDPDGRAMERYYLPMAVMDLRQGVGRLIRSQHHRGVIVIGDRKLGLPGRLNALYRNLFLGSLDSDLVPNAAGDYRENLFTMADGWREIWSFFAKTPPLTQGRVDELNRPEALEELTLLPSIRAIRQAQFADEEEALRDPKAFVERCTAIARLLSDKPEMDLKPEQEAALLALASGRDLLGVLPTGYGKSFIFQLPALALPGVTVVVSPLVSLMTDQALGLNRSIGGAVRALVAPMRESNSRTGKAEVQAQLAGVDQGIKVVYLSPERLCQAQFQAWIRRGVELGVVRRIAIDEAHTFVTWGEDFRPSFKRAEGFLAELRAMPRRPQLIALTATATQEVRSGLRRAIFGLKAPDPTVLEERRINPIRPELALYRRTLSGPVATERMMEMLVDEVGNDHTIIYSLTIKEAQRLYNALREHLGDSQRDRVRLYHGRLNPSEKELVANEFKQALARGEEHFRPMVIVATAAFGLGVDRDDIRTVVVASPPNDLAALYQQLGRAGRDGQGATGIMLSTGRAIRTLRFMNSKRMPSTMVPDIVTRLMIDADDGWVDTDQIARTLVLDDIALRRLPPEAEEDDQVIANYRTWVMRVLAELDAAGFVEDLGDFPETVSVIIRDETPVPAELESSVEAVSRAVTDPRAVEVAAFAQAVAPDLPDEVSDPPSAWTFLLDLHQLGLADVSQRPNKRTLTAVRALKATVDQDLSKRFASSGRDDELAKVVGFFNSTTCVNDDFREYFGHNALPSGTCKGDRRCSICWGSARDGSSPAVLQVLSSAVTGKSRRKEVVDRAPVRRRAAVHIIRLLRWRRTGLGPFFLRLTLKGEEFYWTKQREKKAIFPQLVESAAFGALPGLTEDDLDETLQELVDNGVLALSIEGRYQMAHFAKAQQQAPS